MATHFAAGILVGGLAIVIGMVALRDAAPAMAKPMLPVKSITAAHAEVVASAETEPVPSVDDAADDAAIWVHPTDASKSLILATDKQNGVFVYTLSGKQQQTIAAGRLNNIDLRQDVGGLAGAGEAIAIATNRTSKTIDLFVIDAAGVIRTAGKLASGFDDPYGASLYKNPRSGQLFAFACDKGGLVRQWEITSESGRLAGREVRSFHVGAQAEGMVCDDEAGIFYIGEEGAGVWAYAADASLPAGEQTRKLVIAGAPHGLLAADVEGLAIARAQGEQPMLVVSSQGNSSFHFHELGGAYGHRGSIVVKATIGSSAADGGAVQETDGIEVLAAPLGPAFPGGVMVVQDGKNAPMAQNFKLIDFRLVLAALKPATASPASTKTTTGGGK